MLSLLKRKPKSEAPAPVIEIEPVVETVAVALAEAEPEPVRRIKQQNIKASEDCCAAFAKIAKAQGMTKGELFEDLVAERYETLQQQGVELELSAG